MNVRKVKEGHIDRSTVKRCLEGLVKTYDARYLATDPLEFLHKYDNPADQEVVGLIASSFAYGRVDGIKRSVSAILSAMGAHPARFVAKFDPDNNRDFLAGFKHRFNDSKDVACLLFFARQMIEASGSIGGFFMKGYSSNDANIKDALTSFTASVLSLDHKGIYKAKKLPAKAGVRFFFPSPADHSTCKRLNLYLRWMVRRKDGLDFGLWTKVSPAKLIIPVDTHIARISRHIGLTKRPTADWKTAEEITASLAEFDPIDPVKYDFALCRLGILDECPSRRDAKKCMDCGIRGICVV